MRKGTNLVASLLVVFALTATVQAQTTVQVTFQVDMNAAIDSAQFFAASDFVFVTGSMNDWSTADTLSDDNNDGIYSKTLALSKDSTYNYKFRTKSARSLSEYEDGDNRTVTPVADTTLDVVPYRATFSDLSGATFGEVQLYFQVDMSIAELGDLYDPDTDFVTVAGSFNGWNTTADTLIETQAEGVYEGLVTFANEQAIPSAWKYKFTIKTADGGTVWESIPDRDIDVSAEDLSQGVYVAQNFTTTPPYYSDVTPNDIFTTADTVVFVVDMRSAYYFLADSAGLPADIQSAEVSGDSIGFVIANGPLVAAGNWETWGPGLRDNPKLLLNDAGQDGDATAGDSLFSLRVAYKAGQANSGEFKFGINGYDNESTFAGNHFAKIESKVVNLIFGAMENRDGEIADALYDEYILVSVDGASVVRNGGSLDYGETVTSVDRTPTLSVPTEFSLSQNYPNPFNPSTNIAFSLPQASTVTLSVYNVLGQKVATLLSNHSMGAGNHTVSFDASSLSSGLYLYRLESGSFAQQRFMTLMK